MVHSPRHDSHSICLFRSYHHQNFGLQSRANPATHRSSRSRRIGAVPYNRLHLRCHAPPLSLHRILHDAHHRRPRHPHDSAPLLFRPVRRNLSHRHGRLLRRAHHHLLVPHEPTRPHRAQRRLGVDDWVRQFGRHCRYIFVPRLGRPTLSQGLFYLYGCHLSRCAGDYHLCSLGLARESKAEKCRRGCKRR